MSFRCSSEDSSSGRSGSGFPQRSRLRGRPPLLGALVAPRAHHRLGAHLRARAAHLLKQSRKTGTLLLTERRSRTAIVPPRSATRSCVRASPVGARRLPALSLDAPPEPSLRCRRAVLRRRNRSRFLRRAVIPRRHRGPRGRRVRTLVGARPDAIQLSPGAAAHLQAPAATSPPSCSGPTSRTSTGRALRLRSGASSSRTRRGGRSGSTLHASSSASSLTEQPELFRQCVRNVSVLRADST